MEKISQEIEKQTSYADVAFVLAEVQCTFQLCFVFLCPQFLVNRKKKEGRMDWDLNLEASGTTSESHNKPYTHVPPKIFCRFQFSHTLHVFEICENFYHLKFLHFIALLLGIVKLLEH